MKEKKRDIKSYLIISMKGLAMGAADVVPGVSGGTIAFISGIYEEFINSLKSINWKAIRAIGKGGLKGFWEHINAGFLLSVFAGIGISVLSLAHLISILLNRYPVEIWSFFFGLIIASAITVSGQIGKWSWKEVCGLLAGTAIAYVITIVSPAVTPVSNWFILLSGIIAICAMILPGISGSFILLLLGKYAYIIRAVAERDIQTLGVFALGCIIGLLLFSHVLAWMFRKAHDLTIAVLTGFMVGSLNKVWPWKIPVESTMIDGVEKVIREQVVMPASYPGKSHILFAISLAIIGFVLIISLEWLATRKRYN